MRPALAILVISVIALSCVVPAAAPALTLDAFTDRYPPSPCLPNTAAPVIFVGAYCDGVTCPPDPPAPCEGSSAGQAGLPGVHGGAARESNVGWESGPTDVHARVRDDLGLLEVASAGGHSSFVDLSYGGSLASQDMNLDLTALGVSQLNLGFGGDVSPTLPLLCRISMRTTLPGPPFLAYTELTLPVTQPGPLAFPFDQFSPAPGFSLADVDKIYIEVGECIGMACDGPFPARAYTIGPIRGEAGVVANRGASWGRLKITYR